MYFRFLFILLLVVSCKKEKYAAIDIYGHAGNGMAIQNSIYHDNTQESIQFAIETEGVFGVEIDVQLSKDGDLWVFHDEQLEIQTNETGCISESTYDKLKNVHYKTANKEKIPRLKDLPLQSYAGKTILIDVKYHNACANEEIDVSTFVERLSEIATEHESIHFIVLSKSKYWVTAFQDAGFEVYYEMDDVSEHQSLVDMNITCEGYIFKNDLCTEEDVSFFHQIGKKVIIFNLRSSKSIKKAMKKQPDGVMVDDIGTALIVKN